jgi:hypothetical protein
MAHDHSDSCECCERTQDAWNEINEIAEALGLAADYYSHASTSAIIEEIEELKDLIRRQKFVLSRVGGGRKK